MVLHVFSSMAERKHFLHRVSPEYGLLYTLIPLRHLRQGFCNIEVWRSRIKKETFISVFTIMRIGSELFKIET